MTTTIESAGPGSEVAGMNGTPILPPLLGDGEGKYRILVLGNSGSGKSTTARVLSKILSIPFISIDELHWGPNWYQAPAAELIEKVQKAMDDTDGSWIAEGDYMHKLNSYVVDRATDVIWLDPPLMLYFPRIFTRTIARLLGFAPPCAPGCPESVREAFFSKDSILWWCLSQHWRNRRRNEERMRWIGIGCEGKEGDGVEREGVPRLEGRRRMRRLAGWGEERDLWLDAVRAMRKAE